MAECTFVILGATGDLAKRKLFPAIYKLIKDKKIKKFAIIGAANSNSSAEKILENSKKFIKQYNSKIWESLKKSTYYQQLNFYNTQDYPKLKKIIEDVEKKHKLYGNKLFYLATLPEHFKKITELLSKNKIVKKHINKKECSDCKHPWSRIVYEKPFGHNLKSAQKINKYILKLFHEKQIYRIDHYLGKELVSNITLVRFTNKIFEPLWNNKNIDSVQIILSEKLGIDSRGKFYDKYGALKDVVQNHMLQMLAVTTMEPPKKYTAKEIRDAKSNLLEQVKIDNVILGQYQEYTKEKDINLKSKTETFAALKLFINNKRWKNVPFYLKTGKALDKKEASIHLKFKMVKCILSKSCPTDSNYLTIKITPEEGFFLELNAKLPGVKDKITTVKMDFCHPCTFGPNSPGAYEMLLLDVINGDQSIFVRSDEIELSWKIIDQIDKNKLNLYKYKKGSKGPKEIELLDPNKKIIWRA
ncbi:glucose-6-phosphate dehydrogenase [Candidatus Dependentiae bacterium]|nr:glucose-6-phosphate dehydrogenase [Candidatus Dependentiae bacterium]